MAKELKLRLEDGNVYAVRTLTIKETLALRKEQKERQKEDNRIKELEKKEDEGKELTEEEQNLIDEAEERDLEFMIKVARMSLSKKHEEFRVKGEDNKEKNKSRKAINKKLSELIDMPDLQKIASFSMTGTITKETEETYTYTEVIDLTAELNAEEEK